VSRRTRGTAAGYPRRLTRNRYEQLTLKANALREELHTEIVRMLNDVVKFKMHIQKGLEEYESFVTDELERELGTDDAKSEDHDADL